MWARLEVLRLIYRRVAGHMRSGYAKTDVETHGQELTARDGV